MPTFTPAGEQLTFAYRVEADTHLPDSIAFTCRSVERLALWPSCGMVPKLCGYLIMRNAPSEEISKWHLKNRCERDDSMSTNSEPQPTDQIEAMFVQLAQGLACNDRTVTLQGVAPATLFFADRPQRVVGHVNSQKFINEWGVGPNNFADDPPNAVVTFMETGDKTPEDATVVLRNPQLKQDNLTYDIELLEGSLPPTSGPCSLFIDPIGRPLSPMSVAGVRRRERRRL
jgi:hypothetical protein